MLENPPPLGKRVVEVSASALTLPPAGRVVDPTVVI
jgi:hypothetical protein